MSLETAVVIHAGAPVIDAAAVGQLLMRAGWRADSLPDQEALGRSVWFVAVAIGGVVGFARIITDYSTVSYLCELVVDAGYRDQGIGRRLIEACQNAVPGARLDLLSTETAQGFYERTGFGPKPGYRRWPA